jgi:hypothetical protein
MSCDLTRYQIDLVNDDICPRCRGELDTGFECLVCGYDAMWIAEQSRSLNEILSKQRASRRAGEVDESST